MSDDDQYDDYQVDSEWCDAQTASDVYPEKDFEGLLVRYYDEGEAELMFRGEFKQNRRRVGQHILFYPNGVLHELSYWVDGYPCGTIIWFSEDGNKEGEKDYGDYGGRARSYIERSYDEDGVVWMIELYENGEQVDEWVESDQEEFFQRTGNNIVREFFKKLYPNAEYPDAEE